MDLEFFTIDNGVYDNHLGLSNLSPITIHPSTDSPARVYNQRIRQCLSQYICFIHADCLTHGFKEAIERTILAYPDFGALGAVGSNKGTKWGRKGNIQEVITVDSCCIVINREHGLLFDEETFSNYHLFVEDMCMQVRATGRKIYTIDIDGYENEPDLVPSIDHFIHCSYSCHKFGFAWGEYLRFRHLLNNKWSDVETT
jgi:hypothetical protein